MMTVINADEIPAFRVRFVMPPRHHEPGDCLVQIVKESAER